MKRILLAMILSLAILLSLSVLSFADGGNQVVLSYEVSANFTFEIPSSPVSLNTENPMFSLSLKGNIDSVDVSVSSEHAFSLVNESTPPKSIGYYLYDGNNMVESNTLIRVYSDLAKWLTVSIHSENLINAPAGIYTDTLTFTIQAN